MYTKEIVCLFLIIFLNSSIAVDENVEVSCTINVKKPAQCVSEKFLSISIDPAVLLAGVNLSENSLRLAKHLKPAYIRIAGPSTQFVKYVDHDDKSDSLLSDDGDCLKITPAIWFGVNEWLKLAKLTPIYGINDDETTKGLWNPKTTLPLFDISEKLNVSCYWQLGYDSSDKNMTRYKQDINILHYILTAYGGRNDTWKIIGSDVSVMPTDQVEDIMMEDNDVLEAVMWEPSGRTAEAFPEKDGSYKILLHQSTKPRTKMWTTVPKSSDPVSFASAILWAKQVGNAAKMGFDVVFRQPRVYELFTDTPIYWFSLLHKELMGCNVLETKTAIFQDEPDVFAHCTRKQNRFIRRGAITVMVVNDRLTKYKVKVKLGNTLPEKSMEIQTYVLTSSALNSTEIFLNGELLTPKVFQEKNPFPPKIRRTKSSSHLLLSLPPSSVGFFVIPGARLPVCIENEKETKLLLEEIEENQNDAFSEEIALQIGSRTSFSSHNLLEEITKRLKDEIDHDEKYYNKASAKSGSNVSRKQEEQGRKVDEKGRKLFIDRVKFADKHKKVMDLQKRERKKHLLEKSKPSKAELHTVSKPKNIELTSEEIEKILKDRAVERAAKKNIIFTDEELDALIRKASKNFDRPRNKRSMKPRQHRGKRAINMHLLEKHAKMDQNPNDFAEHFYEDFERPKLQVRNRRSTHSIKKRVRSSRDINFDLLDLKSKIAEHKRAWRDKKEELLGNSNTIKETIKDRIRELKSNMRIKRDINKDLLKKTTKALKKTKKSKSMVKKTDEIEATIRQAGETSADILEQMEHAHAMDDEEEEEENKGEIFAELADPEDIEAEFLIDVPRKTKKLKLFDKKQKIDPFAIERPTIDIVEPTRRRGKNKKSKSDDKLQFLTSSEEFTDVEDDVPGIHEFYGPEFISEKKKNVDQGGMQEVNEFYGVPSLYKREVSKSSPGNTSRSKRSPSFTFLEYAKFDKDPPKPDDILQDLLADTVLEVPYLDDANFYNYVIEPFENDSRSETTKEKMNEEMKLTTIPVATDEIDEGSAVNEESSIMHGVENEVDDLKIDNLYKLYNNTNRKDNIMEKHEYDQIENYGNSEIQPNDYPINDTDTSNNEELPQLDHTESEYDSLDESPSGDLEDSRMKGHTTEESYHPDERRDIPLKKRSLDWDGGDMYDELAEEIFKMVAPVESSEKVKKDKKKSGDKKATKKSEPEEADSLEELFRLKRNAEVDGNSNQTKKKKKKPTKKAPKKVKLPASKKEHMKMKARTSAKNDNKSLSEQMNIIRDKLQERKDEIDKMLKKQKEMEHNIKEQWKTKLAKKKEISKTQNDEKSKDSVASRMKDEVNRDKSPKKKLVKRGLYLRKYQPITRDLKIWQPSDMSSLRRDLHFPKKAAPPNDFDYFKNLLSSRTHVLNRKRRFIHSDVDPTENEIDNSINEIEKELPHVKANEDYIFGDFPNWEDKLEDIGFKPEVELKLNFDEDNNGMYDKNNNQGVIANIANDFKDKIRSMNYDQYTELFKNNDGVAMNNENIDGRNQLIDNNKSSSDDVKNDENMFTDDEYIITVPKEDTFEIVKKGDDTEIKFMHHEPLGKIEDSGNINRGTFIPEITTRSMKPLEDIEQFFGQVKKLFDKIGEGVKDYFNKIGMNY